MRKAIRWGGAGVALLAVLYAIWPFWAGFQLRQAMRARDIASLESRVDWPTLRTNLKPRLTAAVEANAKDSNAVSGYLKRVIGGAVADKGVDLFVTPANLSRILAGRAFVASRLQKSGEPVAKSSKPAVEDDPEDPDDPMPPRRLKWAFFESPTRFRLEAVHPRFPGARIHAHLELKGFGWKLVDVRLVEGA